MTEGSRLSKFHPACPQVGVPEGCSQTAISPGCVSSCWSAFCSCCWGCWWPSSWSVSIQALLGRRALGQESMSYTSCPSRHPAPLNPTPSSSCLQSCRLLPLLGPPMSHCPSEASPPLAPPLPPLPPPLRPVKLLKGSRRQA